MSKPSKAELARLEPYRQQLARREAAHAVIFARHGVPVTAVNLDYQHSMWGGGWGLKAYVKINDDPPFDDPFTLCVCAAAGAMGQTLYLHLVEGIALKHATHTAVQESDDGDKRYIRRRLRRARASRAEVDSVAMDLVEKHWGEIEALAVELLKHPRITGGRLRRLLSGVGS